MNKTHYEVVGTKGRNTRTHSKVVVLKEVKAGYTISAEAQAELNRWLDEDEVDPFSRHMAHKHN